MVGWWGKGRGDSGESCCRAIWSPPCQGSHFKGAKLYMDTTATVISASQKRRREAIQITLAHRAGGTLDACAVAEAFISTWRQVDGLLAPVIGTQGVDVIFRRALYLTSKTFPWLASGEEYRDGAVLLASLKARLESRCADDIAEAVYLLLVCFTELLTTLIGESLTELVLAPIWDFPSASSEQEIAS